MWRLVRLRLPPPSRSRTLTEISWLLAKSPELGRLRAGAWSPQAAKWIPTAISAPLSLASKFRCPTTETAPSRDWFECGATAGKGREFGVARAIRRATNNAQAVRECAVDCSFDEIGCEERPKSRRSSKVPARSTPPERGGGGTAPGAGRVSWNGASSGALFCWGRDGVLRERDGLPYRGLRPHRRRHSAYMHSPGGRLGRAKPAGHRGWLGRRGNGAVLPLLVLASCSGSRGG